MLLALVVGVAAAVSIDGDVVEQIRRLSGAGKGVVTLQLSREEMEHANAEDFLQHEARRLSSRYSREHTGRKLAAADAAPAGLLDEVPLIIDTGTHHTAFPCAGCAACGDHTDPYFDPAASSTSHVMTCSDCPSNLRSRLFDPRPAGTAAAVCQRRSDTCRFGQSYSEGSSWNAYELTDRVWLGRRGERENAEARL